VAGKAMRIKEFQAKFAREMRIWCGSTQPQLFSDQKRFGTGGVGAAEFISR